MAGKPKKETDLTKVEQDHVDGSSGLPMTGTGDRLVIHLEARVLMLTATTLAAAWFIHNELGVVDGLQSLGYGAGVVLALSRPTRYISRFISTIGTLLGKLGK